LRGLNPCNPRNPRLKTSKHARTHSLLPRWKIREKCSIVNEQLEGEAITYDEAGNLVRKACFKAGKLDGEATSYDPSGRVTQKALFQNGE